MNKYILLYLALMNIVAFIRQAVAESCAKTKIVLTHHVPTQLCTASEFKGSTINGAFTVEIGRAHV